MAKQRALDYLAQLGFRLSRLPLAGTSLGNGGELGHDHMRAKSAKRREKGAKRGQAQLTRRGGVKMTVIGPLSRNFSGASVFGEDAAHRLFPTVPDTDFETRYHLAEDRGAAHGASGPGAGIWRIPSLRNVSRTAPYFHNGSVESLDEAVRVMARVQLNKKLSNRAVDDRAIFWSGQDRQLTAMSDQALSDAEVEEIVSFLEALSAEIPSPPQ